MEMRNRDMVTVRSIGGGSGVGSVAGGNERCGPGTEPPSASELPRGAPTVEAPPAGVRPSASGRLDVVVEAENVVWVEREGRSIASIDRLLRATLASGRAYPPGKLARLAALKRRHEREFVAEEEGLRQVEDWAKVHRLHVPRLPSNLKGCLELDRLLPAARAREAHQRAGLADVHVQNADVVALAPPKLQARCRRCDLEVAVEGRV